MQVILKQTFPLGRFHANPWRMFPFEDPHGEWPPSPWRLLRAILARSHQLEREYGVQCQLWRESLVRAFCTSTFGWCLPVFSWRGPGLRQYQPAMFEWDPPNRTKKVNGQPQKIPGEKKYRPTLVRDNFWVVDSSGTSSSSGVMWWVLDGEQWSEDDFNWLDASLERMIYFGRAEAITEIRRVEMLPKDAPVNCILEQHPSSSSVPVLAPAADATLEQVQAVTDDPLVAKSTMPPGARWLHAKRPVKPPVQLRRSKPRPKKPKQLVQFAVGSRVSPRSKSVVVLTQRFRGRVIRELLGSRWQTADLAQRHTVRLLTGKEADGSPLQDDQHPHARFGVLFDTETDRATRLLVWRNQPFTEDEERAILDAGERELKLAFGKSTWAIRLVPLDSQVQAPLGFDGQLHRRWETQTLYVPPRHMYNRRGRVKQGESPEEQIRLELERQGYDVASLMISLDDHTVEWVQLHRPRRVRRSQNEPTNNERRGFRVSLTFDKPVSGPICLGHSSHFGLGLFIPVDSR